jgi:hypothetical protein
VNFLNKTEALEEVILTDDFFMNSLSQFDFDVRLAKNKSTKAEYKKFLADNTLDWNMTTVARYTKLFAKY